MAFKFVRSPKGQAKWFEYAEGFELLVAPANNNHWMLELFNQIKFEQLAQVSGEQDLLAGVFRDKTTAEAHAVVAHLMAKAILVDWKGLEDEDGNEILYSVENATELLRLEGDVRNFVERKSQELFAAGKAAAEDIKKK
ncbi:hypothetical protein Sp245p_28920 (plasmid) [Azospirillum baldaniorum]|uniref:Tail assembly chaperone n=1 Tax=Azospirillum baldaniorum TaxID=1064539 RepID=A0A9P1JY14_9PROT|nr:hypothetical protein [Azospirillum baldaniorum]AWJ93845.1 hypothetical protein Sp245p_28920 [Azospirillum baldaniorum]TWA81669.1 hypothetical protein FBZ85_10243 [Azospirillum brasilense]CCD02005.1 protein of unknown function [Azospirillum baldaniorum]